VNATLEELVKLCLIAMLVTFAVMFIVFVVVILTAVISTLAEKVRCWKRERKAKK
jgi:H+/gluconate symporter-like permease